MKKYIKLSGLAAICTVFVTAASVFGVANATTEERTLVEYLNDKNISFLIVNSGHDARLTTFGWQDADKSCKTIRNAGFNVGRIRNFTAEEQVESNATCVY